MDKAPKWQGTSCHADFLADSDVRKVLLAILLCEKPMGSNDWIAKRLLIGHPGLVSHLFSAGRGIGIGHLKAIRRKLTQNNLH